MATTHTFIVNAITFKYHLEYMFAGTGAKDKVIDFNNTPTSNLHSTTENNLLGMIADSQRVRVGDYVIFYLLQNFEKNIYEGKFYGVFRVKEAPSFLDNNDGEQFLKDSLGKSLTFRTIIEPYQVYAKGVTEWEALDEIKDIHSPYQMLWSLIYRKLKANRGNTMITIYESERLNNLIRNKNNSKILHGENFSFNERTEEIESVERSYSYAGRKEILNILPRLVRKYNEGKQFETHLQVYLLQNIENLPMFSDQHIEWIGNEVSCGCGTQRIDIMLSIVGENRKIILIELKSGLAKEGIMAQLQRYVDWAEQYYVSNAPSCIEPMIISRKIRDKTTQAYGTLISSFDAFNLRNEPLKLRYIEFSINTENDEINFDEIIY